ncbi:MULTISPECIES: hypothetical protein [Pseudomonas]|uniref:hypothetical protein n=1 Tax=Pseudomonas TaxID=286 RepID=UPI001EE2C59A|nr:MULTISPECIES: hypothetical protein [Pseudomonas]WEZ90856.1 hypothetical protein P3R38_11475 [Pseudomonas sp. NyZ480]
MPSIRPRTDMRTLVLGMVLLACLATLGNTLYVANRVQHGTLIQLSLRANQAHASKVASSIAEFLRSPHSHLRYSARKLATGLDETVLLQSEAHRLQAQDKDFNSIVMVNPDSQVLMAYPDIRQIASRRQRSPEIHPPGLADVRSTVAG